MEDNLLLTDSDLGIVEFPVLSLGQEIHHKWYNLEAPPVDHITGDIHLQISRQHSSLTVKVLECNNLAAQDPNGFSDPYVTLTYGKQKKKTQCIKKNLNPYFGECFLFDWEDASSPLEVRVWDWDRFGGNDFLFVFFFLWLWMKINFFFCNYKRAGDDSWI